MLPLQTPRPEDIPIQNPPAPLPEAITHGTFLKTPTSHATEILERSRFDFLAVDAEHAPFASADIDMLMLAARAAAIPSVVRIASADEAQIQTALDCGAAGVLVPHVYGSERSRRVVAASRFRGGRRGFFNSPRAGAYGVLGVADHMAAADTSTDVIAVIEDPQALDALDDRRCGEGR